MVHPSSLDRARGALLGSAVGDALGAPLEGLGSQQIHSHYDQVADFVDGSVAWPRKPYRWRMPGLYSDDTQQALALADVLLDHGRIVPERLSELFLALADQPGKFLGAYRGVGRSFREAMNALRRGEAATGQSSAGAGAAARITPVALYYAGKPEAMAEAVLEASLITHRDCRALAGALAVAHAVRRLAAGASREPSLILRLAGDVAASEALLRDCSGRVCGTRPFGSSLACAVAHVESILDRPRPAALAALVEEANRHGPSKPCRRATMGFAAACIPTCLYLLMVTDSFEEAVMEAVNLGGDADNAGAIVGAMAGAYYGVGAIPDRWLDRLHNRAGVDLRAEALSRRTRDGLAIPELVATESALTAQEDEYTRQVLVSVNGHP